MSLRSLRLLAWLLIVGLLVGHLPQPAPVAAQPVAASVAATPASQALASGPTEVVAPPIQLAPVTDPHRPSLTLHLTVAPDPVPVGETAAFTLTVANQAPDPATKVVVTLPTPDGALAEPGTGVINPAKGWQWTLDQVAALSEVQFTGVVRLVRMPSGDALVFRPEVTAAELPQPVAIFGGALVWDRAKGSVQSSFAPGKVAALQGENGRLTVTFPANAARTALGLQYRTLEIARADLLAQHRRVPPTIANFKRALAPVVLDATDAAGVAVHQFDAPLTLAWRYTPEQLLARGISAADLTVFWFDETIGQWVPVPSTVDEQTQTVSTIVDHFSAFTLGDGSSPSSAYLPSLQGWQVSSFTGAVSYNYPIDVPAGPSGLKPTVSLNYSSATTDGTGGARFKQQAGMVGKGWSLDFGSVGVRTIVRDASTANMVKTYTLTLNGQSYDIERGAGLVGSPNPDVPSDWEWHTTDESYLKIRAVPNGTSTDHDASIVVNQVYDPATNMHGRGGMLSGTWQTRYRWQIWAKDGTRYDYTEDLWSGLDRCAIASEYDFEPYKWLLSSVTDTHNNTITYSYARQVYVAGQWNCGNRTVRGTIDRDAWPTAITWANNRYRVVFQTAARTNDTAFDGPDNQYAHDNGVPHETRELDAIVVQSSTDGTNWNRIRQYNLAQNYSLYSDQRLCTSGGCTANTTYPKLTLTGLQLVGRDGTSALPQTTFTYETNGGTTVVAADGWQRLKTANNGQGGTATFAYNNIQAVTGKNIFVNRQRVTSKTFTDGRGATYTWAYTYGTPAMNSLGTLIASKMDTSYAYQPIYAQGPNVYPNSAILYLNRYADSLHPYDSWLAQGIAKEFRGHDWVQEVDPSGGVTKHFFYQGDVGCYPDNPDGSPLGGETNIKNDTCFQAIRDREFLKGREYDTQVLASSSATNPLQRTIHTFGVTFFDYGTERLSGLWHAFTHEDQTETRSHEGDSSYRSSKVGYCYFATCGGSTYQSADYGNLTRKAEYDDSGAVIRRTEYFYLTTNTASDYLVDRVYQEQVTDGAGVFRALTSRFYDNTSTPTTAPTDGDLRRESRYYDVPAATAIPNGTTMHGVDTVYGYDSYGNRTTVTTYAGYGLRVKDGSGVITWSAPGNGSAATTTTTTYDATFHAIPTQEVNALGQTTRADYDAVTGKLIRITGPNTTGTPTNCAVASFSLPTTEESTCATYDVFGRMTMLIKPGDSTSLPTVEWVYADTELPVRYVTRQREVSGQTPYRATQTFYDGLGRAIQVKRLSGRDATGAASQVIMTDTQYDGLGRVTKASQPRYVNQSGTVYSSYTAPGTFTNPTTTTYDALGRQLTVTAPDTTKTQYSYGEDSDGRWAKTIDANAHAVVQWSDTLGRLRLVREYTGTVTPRALYATTNYTYNALDALVGVDDTLGNHTTLGYDTLGRKTSMTDPDMGTWAYGYDPDGNLTTQTDAKGQGTTFYYDALNRLTGKTMAGGWTAAYAYDDTTGANKGIGHRTSMSTAFNSFAQTFKRWEYDARGRTTLVGQSVGGIGTDIAYGYDTADRIVTTNYYEAGETVSTTYDAAWRPSSLCSSLGGCYVGSATYTALDQPDVWTLNGSTLTRDATYNSMARMTGLTVTGSGGTILNRGYGYDNVGNITSMTDATPGTPLGNQTFGYDDLNRLTSWVSSLGTQSYGYDKLGNLTTKAGTTQTYGASGAGTGAGPHQVRTAGGTLYSYDANGNLSTGAGWTYTWNADNTLASLSNGSSTESYTYDADGERVLRSASGVTTVYFEGLWEQTTAGARTLYYTFHGQVVALRTSAGVTYLHGDHLGSVSASSDGNGGAVTRQYFNPWGQVASGGISATALNFTGQRLDATGLLYYHARYYNPVLGRFASADTLVPGNASGSVEGVAIKGLTVDFHEPGFVSSLSKEHQQDFWFRLSEDDKKQAGSPWGPANPQSLNRYSYVLNGPVRWMDPTGHCVGVMSCTLEGAALGTVAEPGGGTAVGAVIGFVIGVGITIGVGAGIAYVVTHSGDESGATVLESRYKGDKRTAGQVINDEKQGRINSQFPGEYKDKTPDQIYKEAKSGNPKARTAKKILDSTEYDKNNKR